MKIQYIIKNALSAIVILLFINTASSASDKLPGKVEKELIDIEVYSEEEELVFEHWMFEMERWEKASEQINLVKESHLKAVTEIVIEPIDLNGLIEAECEEDLQFESWMLN